MPCFGSQQSALLLSASASRAIPAPPCVKVCAPVFPTSSRTYCFAFERIRRPLDINKEVDHHTTNPPLHRRRGAPAHLNFPSVFRGVHSLPDLTPRPTQL